MDTVHGWTPFARFCAQVSPNPRRAVVINVFRDGVVSNMGGEKQGDMGKFGWVRKGQKCEGKYHLRQINIEIVFAKILK